MKKIIAAVLAFALLVTPSFALAGEPTSDADVGPGQSAVMTAEGIAAITAAGQVVGCQTGGFGGALAQTFGAALQQAIPGFIRSQLGNALGRLASQAGPFGQVIQAIGNIAINRLSSYIQNQIGNLIGTETINQVLGTGVIDAVTSGAGAGIALAVPISLAPNIKFLQDTSTTQENTHRGADAGETSAQKECVGDVLARKLANALLSMLFKTTIDFVNSGFNGDAAFIENLRQFLHFGVETVTRDFITNQLSGMCSTQRSTVQTLVLTQYQYQHNFGSRVQCKGDEQGGSRLTQGGWDFSALYTSGFNESLEYYAYFNAEDERLARTKAAVKSETVSVLADGVWKDRVVCDEGGAQAQSLSDCPGGKGRVVVPRSLTADQAKEYLKLPKDQLLNADEIAEIIDALTSSVTQVALQGVDGLFGLSSRNGSQGSYLDAMVAQTTGTSQGVAQNAVAGDISAAGETEVRYRNTLTSVLTGLSNVKTGYTVAIACFTQKLNVAGVNQAQIQLKIQNASSTIATVINPQIANLTALIDRSDDTLDQLSILSSQAQSALTPASIVQINQQYTALLQTGRVHSASDLSLLLTEAQAVANSINLLAVDAGALVSECQSL